MRLRALTAAIGAALALVVAGPATASDADGARAQATALQGEAYLGRVMGVPMPRRPLIAGELVQMAKCGRVDGLANAPKGCDGMAYSDAIVMRPGLIGRLARLGDPVNRLGGDAFAAVTLIHEELHTDRDLAPIDEGVIDAIAADLTPGFLHYIQAPAPLFGMVPLHYPTDAATVRKASARATGTGWISRAARLWRRALWPLTSAERDALVVETLR